MPRITSWLRIGAVAAVAALLASTPQAQADIRPGREPGLPYIECDAQLESWGGCNSELGDKDLYGWLNTNQNGLAGSVKARQWARVPVGVVAVNASFVANTPPYREGLVPEGVYVFAQAFFVSPRGSGTNYGDSMNIPVRTVAFGSIPVEVTLQVRQRRDAQDLPIPFRLDSMNIAELQPDRSSIVTDYPTRIQDKVSIRVRSVKVDGVDVGLGSRCQTPPTAELDVVSEIFVSRTEDGAPSRRVIDFDPAHGFQGLEGGTFNGKISIPAFRGCTTRTGDDVSALLTSAVSGADNPVSVRAGSLTCTRLDESGFSFLPPAPGTVTDPADCSVPYPDLNPRIVPIPKPFDIPDQAPQPVR